MSLYSSSMLSVSSLPQLKSSLCSLPLKSNPWWFCAHIRHFPLPQALRPAETSDSTEEKASCHGFQTWQPGKTPEQSRRQTADEVVLYPESDHFYWNATIREFSCMYSAGIARYMGTCKVWSVTIYGLVKLGYIFTYLAKATFSTPKLPARYLPDKYIAAPEQGTWALLKVICTTNVNTAKYYFIALSIY